MNAICTRIFQENVDYFMEFPSLPLPECCIHLSLLKRTRMSSCHDVLAHCCTVVTFPCIMRYRKTPSWPPRLFFLGLGSCHPCCLLLWCRKSPDVVTPESLSRDYGEELEYLLAALQLADEEKKVSREGQFRGRTLMNVGAGH